jgi:sterol desaturase/sphingolipid hydroxylase (fatty acid hydroxylase superfamily)
MADNSTASNAEPIVGPFTDMVQQFPTAVWNAIASNIPGDLHWDRILITLFFAILIFFYYQGRGSKGADGYERKVGILQFLLPVDIYTHVSARVDIWLWVLERVLRPFWVVALFATVGPYTEQSVIAGLEFLLGATPALETNFIWMLLYALVSLLCYDFIFYVIHYTMHKIPALWAIHKIHHSA